MIYIGIDIAKNTHWASAMNSDGEILLEPFSFQNNNEGFQKFISKLSNFDKQKMLIGLESTAHYGENIISYLFNLDYKIGIINPIQTSNLRKSNIRKTKNDKVDTFIIIKSLTLNNYNLVTTRDINNIKLKGLSRSRHNLIVMRSRSKIQLASFIDQLFPELNKFFKGNLHLNVSYQLLKEYSSPKDISSLHLTKLSNILHDNSHGRYNKEDAIRLRELAKNSVGIDNPTLSLQIKQAILQIELYTEQIEEVEKLSKQILDEMKSKLLTIPGMSYNQATVIHGFIGDISRFNKSCQLLAYSGLDPSIYQSGNFEARSTRMSKRGNSLLRYNLVYAAHNLVLHNNTFKEYYDLKRSQGKSHYCALGHCAHKLVRIIFKMLKSNIDFDLD
jgi:transposase